MSHINCNFCGEKIWGDETSLPEIGLCTPCKKQRESTKENSNKLDSVLNLLAELREEQEYICDKIYNLEKVFFDELKSLKTEINEITTVQALPQNDENNSDSNENNWEYSEGDARSEMANADYEGELNEAAYSESEAASEQCGEDYDY